MYIHAKNTFYICNKVLACYCFANYAKTRKCVYIVAIRQNIVIAKKDLAKFDFFSQPFLFSLCVSYFDSTLESLDREFQEKLNIVCTSVEHA